MNDYSKLHRIVGNFKKLADEDEFVDVDAYEMDQQWQRENPGELQELETSFDAMKAAVTKFVDTFDRIDGEPNIRSDRGVEVHSIMWTSLDKMRELYADLVAELDPSSGE